MTNTRERLLAYAVAHRAAIATESMRPALPAGLTNLSGADLSDTNFSHADLSDANLSDANLSGANLCDANLSDANLSHADLSGTNLNYADLRGANLSHADLSDTNLNYANLSGANLSHADLNGANLRYADLSDTNLNYANLRGAYGLPSVAVIPGLAAAVLAQIEQHPETYDQSFWHCNTKHCAAGWIVTLAGDDAREVEKVLGTANAALLALGLPLSTACPFGTTDNPLPWLRKLTVQG